MNPYQQGQDDYKDGKEPSENPYQARDNRDDWLEGWLDARGPYQGEGVYDGSY